MLTYLWDNPITKFFKYVFSTVWNGLVWIFNVFITRDDIAIETSGE